MGGGGRGWGVGGVALGEEVGTKIRTKSGGGVLNLQRERTKVQGVV